MAKTKPILWFLIVCIGIMMTVYYARAYAETCMEYCGNAHREIIDGTAVSPHRYRILAPFVVEAVFRPQSDQSVAVAYVAAHVVALPAMLIALFQWFRKWASEFAALAGVLLIAAYSPIMFIIYGISLNNPIEIILLCAGLLWLLAKRDGAIFAVLIALATLNRETGVLLVLAYAAINLPHWRERPVQIKTIAYGAVWASIFIGLRLWRGSAPDMLTVAEAWASNTNSWVTSDAISNHAFLIPLWIATLVGIRRAPVDLRRIALVGIPYLLLLIPFSLWNETRLLLPLLTLWTPLALFGLSASQQPT